MPFSGIDGNDWQQVAGNWGLGSGLATDTNLVTNDSNALCICDYYCEPQPENPDFGYTAIVSGGMPGGRLIGAYQNSGNYWYVEGANIADVANYNASSIRLGRVQDGVDTVIGTRLMFDWNLETGEALGISWGLYGVRTAVIGSGLYFGSGPYYRGYPGTGLQAGLGTGTIDPGTYGPAVFYGFSLGKANKLFSYSNVWNPCTGLVECCPCSDKNGEVCDNLEVTISGIGTWQQVWGPSCDFSPINGTYTVTHTTDWAPVKTQQGLTEGLGACFWQYSFDNPVQIQDSASNQVTVKGIRVSLSIGNTSPYNVSIVAGCTVILEWPPQWDQFPPYGFSGPLTIEANSGVYLPLYNCSTMSDVLIPIGQGTCVVN